MKLSDKDQKIWDQLQDNIMTLCDDAENSTKHKGIVPAVLSRVLIIRMRADGMKAENIIGAFTQQTLLDITFDEYT